MAFARQRRVALAATIDIRTERGVRALQLVNAHLEPLSSTRALWVFTDPRRHQVQSILDLLNERRFTDPANAGVVFGGDFNTIRAGHRESAYRLARAWATSQGEDDGRRTHLMGRLDYLFFRLDEGWKGSTHRIDDRFGSDHSPVMGQFTR